ncbi:MAG: phosphoenolpyruvate--protein phosphotransferase [Candidatus Aminicenantes bacterium]|nr:phosphoenolpyruvate--protein phosphotransferase [Candidatus Aminicenantes bacterium]
MKIIKGKPVSAGIVTGKALLFNSKKEIILKEKIDKEFTAAEIDRFNKAVKKTRGQLKKIYDNLQKIMGKEPALIIDTQYALLTDGNLTSDIKHYITANSVKAEWAIKQVEKKYFDFFNKIPDLSFREKSNDISDVLIRVINNLQESEKKTDADIENVILVADDLPPSIAAGLMSKGKVLGLVLDEGGETSHTVILARTLEIPVVLETKNATETISSDDFLVVNGLSGEILINPPKSTISKVSIKKEKYRLYKEKLKEVIKLPDKTKDNYRFNLLGNIEMPFESELALSYGAKGLGLFRTEFLFMDRAVALSTERQYMIYKNIAQKIFPGPVVIRTYDIGRDKADDYFKGEAEANPNLGSMAVRLLLPEKKIFKKQVKAILRANKSGNIKIMFPMITEIEEIHTIKKILAETKEELENEQQYPGKDVEIGIMIEIPGTIKLIKHLRDEIDFFSIGTNDLIQYLLAVDRNNSAVSYLYNPYHPAVIESLMEIAAETAKIGKEVTICGEMAGQVFTALMLLGMGYRNFSMNPLAIIEIKRIFTRIHYSYLKKVVKQLTGFSSRTEVEEYLIEALLKRYPDLFVKHPDF